MSDIEYKDYNVDSTKLDLESIKELIDIVDITFNVNPEDKLVTSLVDKGVLQEIK